VSQTQKGKQLNMVKIISLAFCVENIAGEAQCRKLVWESLETRLWYIVHNLWCEVHICVIYHTNLFLQAIVPKEVAIPEWSCMNTAKTLGLLQPHF